MKLGAVFGDTRDQSGGHRFIPYNVEEFFSNDTRNMDFIRNADFYKPFQSVRHI